MPGNPAEVGPAGRVLLVGDEPLNRGLVTRILELGGYLPVVADGPAAAAELARSGVALVIRDLAHTATADPDLAAQVEAAEPRTPLIYLTGDAICDHDDGAGHHVVAKPFSCDHLLDVVAGAIAHAATGRCDGFT